MSYSEWHTYGYGICVSDITDESVERLQKLISLAPEYQKKIQAWLDECEISEPAYEDYLEFDQERSSRSIPRTPSMNVTLTANTARAITISQSSLSSSAFPIGLSGRWDGFTRRPASLKILYHRCQTGMNWIS